MISNSNDLEVLFVAHVSCIIERLGLRSVFEAFDKIARQIKVNSNINA